MTSIRHRRVWSIWPALLLAILTHGCQLDLQGDLELEAADVITDTDVSEMAGDIPVDTGIDPDVAPDTVLDTAMDGDAGDPPVDTVEDAEDVPSDETPDLPPCDGPTTVYYIDEDGDGFGWIGGGMESCEQPPGFVENHDDCEDDNPDVHPDQAAYFSVDRGDGSFDYDCDLFQTPRWTSTTECYDWQCDGEGWYGGSAPPCGVTAQWRHCYWEWFWCVVDDSDRTQECR